MRATPKRVTRNHEILYGVHPIIECLKAGKRSIYALYMTKPEPKGWDRIKRYFSKYTPPIQYVSRDTLTRLAQSSEHMGIVAYVAPYEYTSKKLTTQANQRILLLDGVQDVHNLGAILRSAYCTNFDAVLVSKKCARMTAGVFKASAGLAEHVPVYLVPTSQHAASELRQMGYHLYMTVADGGKSALDVSFKPPFCVVIGSEEQGIAKAVREQGTQVTLPQKDTSSYNASVAAGIFLFIAAFANK
jgi:23S rRNA (guanosine2251-2'-O)-methyltransferase